MEQDFYSKGAGVGALKIGQATERERLRNVFITTTDMWFVMYH